MEVFAWDQKFATGIESIDTQHKKLLSFVNELNDAMRQRKGSEAVGAILAELKKYTEYHFANEEAVFDKYQYPESEGHKKIHASLVMQIDGLIEKHKKGEFALSITVLDFLMNWVTSHILGEDMKYVPFFKDKSTEFNSHV